MSEWIKAVDGLINEACKGLSVALGGTYPDDEPARPRPPECFEGEDVYRWLLAEARWLLGPVAEAMHRIRLAEHTFEHDSVQRDCSLGQPPPDQHCV